MDADSERIAQELVAMAEEDERLRAELAADGSLFDGYHPRMEDVQRRNAARLLGIVERHGWPGRSKVGEHAAWAAWLILQHAIGDPSLQRRGLKWLEGAAVRGEVPRAQVAMLEDRIRVFEGKPQRYGTQLDEDETGELVPFPIEDPGGVDARRAAVGLPPLDGTLRLEREQRAREARVVRAQDWAERRRRWEAWLHRVGWRP
jgi:hypothetical protein